MTDDLLMKLMCAGNADETSATGSGEGQETLTYQNLDSSQNCWHRNKIWTKDFQMC